MSSARAEILARIRVSLGDAGPEPHTRQSYRRSGTLDTGARTELFCERASEYRATVTRCASGDLGRAVGEACAERGVTRLLVAPDAAWSGMSAVELIADDGLGLDALDSAEGVLTECALAIAETGTVALDGGRGQGRRALTLVPDLHICVVRAERIVELVPEAVALLAGPAVEGRAITLVSGPSATSDIELDRVEGVHGPRNLVLVVVESDQSP